MGQTHKGWKKEDKTRFTCVWLINYRLAYNMRQVAKITIPLSPQSYPLFSDLLIITQQAVPQQSLLVQNNIVFDINESCKNGETERNCKPEQSWAKHCWDLVTKFHNLRSWQISGNKLLPTGLNETIFKFPLWQA